MLKHIDDGAHIQDNLLNVLLTVDDVVKSLGMKCAQKDSFDNPDGLENDWTDCPYLLRLSHVQLHVSNCGVSESLSESIAEVIVVDVVVLLPSVLEGSSHVQGVHFQVIVVPGLLDVSWVSDCFGSVVKHAQVHQVFHISVVAMSEVVTDLLEGKRVLVNSNLVVPLSSLSPRIKAAFKSFSDLDIVLESAFNKLVEVLGVNRFSKESFDHQFEVVWAQVWNGVVIIWATKNSWGLILEVSWDLINKQVVRGSSGGSQKASNSK